MPVTFQKNLKFQPKPEKILEEFKFDGGLITDAHETKLKPNQSPNLGNVLFNDTGSIKTRNGYLRYNPVVIGSGANIDNSGAHTGWLSITTNNTLVAQTFTLGGDVPIVSFTFYLNMANADEEQYVRAEIWSTSSNDPSAYLASSQMVLISGVSVTPYIFHITNTFNGDNTVRYTVVLKPVAPGSASSTVKQVDVAHRGSTVANGSVYTSADGGINWTADTAKDLRFVMTVDNGVGCTGLIRYYGPAGVKQLLTKINATLYRGNDITGGIDTITLGSGGNFATDNFLDWTVFNDTLLVVDGVGPIQKYRGSVNNTYTFSTIDVVNGSDTVDGGGGGWADPDNVVAGEYIQLPDNKWYRIVAILDADTLQIETEYQGATLSTQSYKISPWGEVRGKLATSTVIANLVVPAPKFIETHINRVWTLEGNTLRFSALDTSIDEEAFNDWDTLNNAGTIIIPAGKGDTGTGLYSINGYLYVFQHNAIWEIFGTSPANFELRNISNEVGLVDKRTVVEYDAYLLFFSGKDVYIFDGANLKNLTNGKINNLINSWANNTSPAAGLWGSNYILSYTPNTESYNSEAIYYDITRDIWGKLKNVPAGVWSVWKGATDEGEIYFASSVQGSIYRWDVGSHDDGYEIETIYETPSIGLSANMNDKVIKKVYLQQIAMGDWDMSVTQYADITDNPITSDINLASGSQSLFDVAQFDVDEFSSEASLITTRITEFQGVAKYFRYVLEQTGYAEGIEVLGITITARLRRLN